MISKFAVGVPNDKSKPMTADEEAAVIRSFKDGNKKALRILLDRNNRFLLATARKYTGRGLDLEDLFQEGARGLMRAAQDFDPSSGLRFLTYAVWWIRQAMMRAIRREGGLIRLPDNFHYRAKKSASPEENARAEERKETFYNSRTPIRMDVMKESQDFQNGMRLQLADENPFQDITFEDRKIKQQIEALVDTLPDRQKYVIRRRFGMLNGDPETLQEVADQMNVCRERVRQLENAAMESLKKRIAQNPIDR